MSEREYTTVMVRKSTKPQFEQAKESVAQEIGGKPTNADVVEELVRAYLGNQPLGEWQDQ
jgi:hypothetical protein